jgi:UDP-N-acetylglucosamine--N-acetylmuramyl-(pentapeptide) pyrophosphoryl-undecaprenol N-acetylglucosamine transferase
MALVNKLAAIYVKDASANAELIDKALQTVTDEKLLKELSDNISKLALPDSANIIAHEVWQLATNKQR